MKTVEQLTAQADEAADELMKELVTYGKLTNLNRELLHTFLALAFCRGRNVGVANLREAQREATASLS